MHDPMVVAFKIRRPWPKRRHPTGAAGRWYWPPLIVVWHREPSGRDSGEICRQHRRVQQPDGSWRTRILHSWKLHVHHWRIQVPPLQRLRRRLLTRCAWCHGRHSRADPVNIGQWNGPRGHWWRGEPGMYHRECLTLRDAHATCLCTDAEELLSDQSILYGPYGACERCGKRRPFGMSRERLDRLRSVVADSSGKATPEVRDAG